MLDYVFYEVKPFIPRSVQIFFRRKIANFRRRNFRHMWPIDQKAGEKPRDWLGWPDGKQFALVLSHDVDSQRGQDRVIDLAELEVEHGFRSTFNFVPERYANHNKIKDFLRTNNFELGVHGLKHDGKLFQNQRIFDQRAVKINKYLKEWGTTGFTAPSMLCRADWLHKLNITHSISTFDTDPFEPQSDGAGTIFPYHVRNSDGGGYVELPYTLPQDHLLFVILQEKNIDLWCRKLDWVAERGGMALLNTHSDYMNFGDCPLEAEEYPVQFYESFLNYIDHQYRGSFYHALPREIASHCVSKIRRAEGIRKAVPNELDVGERSNPRGA